MNDINKTHHQVDCIKLLLSKGADSQKLNKEKSEYLSLLAKDDLELQSLLDREK